MSGTCATPACTYPAVCTAPDGLPCCAACAEDWVSTEVLLHPAPGSGTLGARYSRTTTTEDTHVQPIPASQLGQLNSGDPARQLEQLDTDSQPHTSTTPASSAGVLRVDNPGES